MELWENISRIDTNKSYLERICWPYDKYPDMQQLTAGAGITLLDVDGPGVVTNIHSSRMDFLDDVLDTQSARETDAYSRVLIEITYDRHTKPDITMPLCEFFGDIDGTCDYFQTLYFSKVRFAHNFRLPLPFAKHIRIVIKNPTQTALIGYTDLQWKKLRHLPGDIGYLYVAYQRGQLQVPEQTFDLCNIKGAGTIRAHWFAIGTDFPLARDGEYVCEGNQEFYVDGDPAPSLEYLGTEDVYSHSWGFAGTGGDGCAAITRMEHPTPERTEIAMLRCRIMDSISFQKTLRVVLDYRNEYYAKDSTNRLHRQGVFAGRQRASYSLDYRSCFYYYAFPHSKREDGKAL